ncbi:hypothetical protein [Spartinivicinus poritis]|uniref:Uncharacterized protein n=1 Tax=Spartinivicinus poritis TaxID=2994640 RepID=A0ABT5UDY9_9GAMM|nr:hypothetical protein [Spartinivicinus sp. A2-2]MDE1464573.1 hypothetical protein [Spartinivicinus sp. A2-2]
MKWMFDVLSAIGGMFAIYLALSLINEGNLWNLVITVVFVLVVSIKGWKDGGNYQL